MVDIQTLLIMARDVQPNPGPANEKEKSKKLIEYFSSRIYSTVENIGSI